MGSETFPLQSQFLGYDDENNPLYDRAVPAIFLRQWYQRLYVNGVYYDPANTLQVTALSGMMVNVNSGWIFAQGAMAHFDANQTITLNPAPTSGNRTDLIIVKFDFEKYRQTTAEVLTNKSQIFDLTRNSDVWDIVLAKITVRQNAVSIEQSDIEDLRPYPEWCGIMNGRVPDFDFETYYIQYQAKWDAKIAALNAQMIAQQNAQNIFINQENSWFTSVQAQLPTYAGFDLDNQFLYPNTTKETIFDYDGAGNIKETLKINSSNVLNAEKTTIFNADGSINENLKVYDPLTSVLIFNRTRTTTFGATIKEVLG